MSYDSTILADTPIAYYKLNEAPGATVAVESVSGHNGTYGGSPTLGATSIVPTDYSDTSATPVAVTALVTLPATVTLLTSDTGATFEFWGYFNAGTTDISFSVGTNTAGGAGAYFQAYFPYSATTMYLYGGNSQAGLSAATIASVPGSVHHWAFTFRNSSPWTVTMYKDGVSIATGVGTAAWGVNLTGGWIARSCGSGHFQNAAIYNKALTATQLLAHYNAGVQAQLASTIAAKATVTASMVGALTAAVRIAAVAAASITSPTPLATVTFSVYRSPATLNQWTRIASGLVSPGLAIPTTFTDYTAAAWQKYDYRVDAIASNGAPNPNLTTNVELDWANGIYLHDPNNAAGTVHFFLYDRQARNETRTPEATLIKLDGRTKPVAEFSGRFDRTVSVYLDMLWSNVTHQSADYEALKTLVDSHTTLCYRDHRGRKVFGVILSLPEADELKRYTTTLNINEVDYTEGV